MKSSKPIFYIKENFLKGGLSRLSIARTINQFKKDLSFHELMVSLPEIIKINHRFKKIIWGNLFPKDYNELGVGNNYYFRSHGTYYELNWILVQVAKNRKELKAILNSRDTIYNFIALGEYDKAKNEIREVEKLYGVSVWSSEMHLLCNSFSEKENLSFELLEKINRVLDTIEDKGKNGYVPLLTHFLFKRSSSQSASSYESELKAIHKRNRNDFQVDRFKYYQFRLNYYAAEERSKLDSLLIYETANALIDKYLSVLNILKWLFDNSETEKLLAIECASKLYSYVEDGQLLPFVAYQTPEKLPDSYYDVDYIHILDSYYTSDYRKTIELCRKYVYKNPNHFDCIRIYAQSMIFMGSEFVPLTSASDSIVNHIGQLVFSALTDSDNSSSLADLYDYNKRIYGLPIASGVHEFILGQRKNNTKNSQRFLSLLIFDPLFSKIWSDFEKNKAISYILESKKHGITGVSVGYYLSLYNNNIGEYSGEIASYIITRDLAKTHYLNGEYDRCIEKCNSLYLEKGNYLSIGQMASEYIFRSFVDSDRKMDAIEFYVERYIQKRALVNSIQTKSFMELLRKERYRRNVRNTIDLQIFVFLNAFEDEQKAHVLQMFMNYLDATSMSSLIDEIKYTIQQEKQEIFLFTLVEGDVLRHLPYIGSTKQMLEEQQVVVQYLSLLKSPKRNLYEEYNKQILELMISYENIKKLDASRIYVNESAIIKYELSECENLYRQLATRNELTKSLKSVYILQPTDGGMLGDMDVKIMQTGFKSTRNVTTDISTQIFNIINQKYLFSKFGLKTYLSTRIRHGVLEGEIRSVFDSLHLMLTTQNNRFTPISYWKNNYGLSADEQDVLMQKLGTFSSSLGQIIEDFKAEVLQIKVKAEDKGMLNYVLPDESKCFAVNAAQSATSDYDAFCAQMLLFMNQVTEQSLVKIRQYIHTTLQMKFVQIIDKLETDVQSLSSFHFVKYLSEAISQSRVNLQGCLAKIEKWFNLQTGVYDDFNLKRLMDLVWNVTERQYPNIKYRINKDIEDADFVVDASHYLDIADLLTILYNNMFGHGKATTPRVYTISANMREEKSIVLHFENLTNENDDVLNAMFIELLKSENRLQLEGRSGLAKVKKIILYDLKGSEEDFTIQAENGICRVDIRLWIHNLKRNDK